MAIDSSRIGFRTETSKIPFIRATRAISFRAPLLIVSPRTFCSYTRFLRLCLADGLSLTTRVTSAKTIKGQPRQSQRSEFLIRSKKIESYFGSLSLETLYKIAEKREIYRNDRYTKAIKKHPVMCIHMYIFSKFFIKIFFVNTQH